MFEKRQNFFRDLLIYPLRYKFLFVFTVLVALVNSYATAYRPKLIGHIIDIDIPAKNLHWIVQSIYLVAVVILIQFVTQLIFIVSANIFAQNIIRDIRNRLFGKLIYNNLSFFNRTPNGVLLTRSVSDIETISSVFSDGVVTIFGDILKIGFIVFMMFNINWKLAIAVSFVIPVMVMLTRYFQKAIKKTFKSERTFTAKLNSFIQERLSGIKIVQIFNREASEFKKFKQINSQLNAAHIRTVFYFAVFFPITEVVSSVAIGLVIFYSGYSSLHYTADVNPGQIIAFILYIRILFRPMRQIADRFNNMQRGLVSAERVLKLINAQENIPDNGKVVLNRIKGDVVFEKVHFSYEKAEKILNGISFQAKAGETVAIVGATGAGKSTIVNLIIRFFDVDSGKIKIDNVNITDIPLQILRQKIGVVSQDVFLFNDSIFNNITLGNDNITKEEVIKVSKDIKLHEFISQLPGDYHYQVKERGATLSVGQRQLIAFLRAMVYNPDILILDEATSSIDNYSEELLQRAIKKITKNRTAIVIAHRLSTIQNADKIITLEKGVIKEIGTHKSLLQNEKGYYKKLYQAQFANR